MNSASSGCRTGVEGDRHPRALEPWPQTQFPVSPGLTVDRLGCSLGASGVSSRILRAGGLCLFLQVGPSPEFSSQLPSHIKATSLKTNSPRGLTMYPWQGEGPRGFNVLHMSAGCGLCRHTGGPSGWCIWPSQGLGVSCPTGWAPGPRAAGICLERTPQTVMQGVHRWVGSTELQGGRGREREAH